jgi:hypothetical protein
LNEGTFQSSFNSRGGRIVDNCHCAKLTRIHGNRVKKLHYREKKYYLKLELELIEPTDLEKGQFDSGLRESLSSKTLVLHFCTSKPAFSEERKVSNQTF